MRDSAQIFFMRTRARYSQCLADSNNLFCIFSQKFAIFATTTLSASSIFTTFVRLYTPLLYGMYMQIAVAQILLLTQVPIYPS